MLRTQKGKAAVRGRGAWLSLLADFGHVADSERSGRWGWGPPVSHLLPFQPSLGSAPGGCSPRAPCWHPGPPQPSPLPSAPRLRSGSMPLNPPLTHLQRHRISGGWGLGREPPGADADALWDGLWVRLAQAQVHQEAAREWLEQFGSQSDSGAPRPRCASWRGPH